MFLFLSSPSPFVFLFLPHALSAHARRGQDRTVRSVSCATRSESEKEKLASAGKTEKHNTSTPINTTSLLQHKPKSFIFLTNVGSKDANIARHPFPLAHSSNKLDLAFFELALMYPAKSKEASTFAPAPPPPLPAAFEPPEPEPNIAKRSSSNAAAADADADDDDDGLAAAAAVVEVDAGAAACCCCLFLPLLRKRSSVALSSGTCRRLWSSSSTLC